ncbi:nucleoside-diphosphate-sugar epimerase [Streptomyces sp. 2333.5]|uniref:NAD-dependent epimerase/dehydratase family protein n=1 Tax=unclassified Streptomyces TaxID=2593676 RepID=UPI000897B30B|nr:MULTISPECIES: NAD-dependent epimerase/dehydratase family protein [unclassified Streptomyces]PJJ06360.1 nucleoside-diphosphate-sugar epimerase [Streptomyces sp. 2333.5]SEE94290.1 Nucleoside-diphosphate-sugar epimerase [Streptomyces sp. 2314.4]SEF09169.1 Nucleoside-diphosphate-sugar epimerase [Streptomyces sp. 2112.2]
MSVAARRLHAVLGAGPAGTTLAAELARRGHAVRLVSRSAPDGTPDGVQGCAADVSTPVEALAAVEGADVVYHCVNVAYHLQTEVMPRVQQAVLAAVEANGARLVVLDTLYPYGQTQGEVMTEETPWRATSRKGMMRAQLDEAYLAAHRAGRARVVLGRSADFVGPGVLNSTLGGAVFPAALTGGEALALGDIDLPHSYTAIQDVARGLAALGEDPAGDGRVWHLPTAPARTTREIHSMIEERVGSPLRRVVLTEPRPFGPFDATFMDEYAEMFYQHTEPQIVDSSAFERTFGLRPAPLEATLDATLDWYRTLVAGARN